MCSLLSATHVFFVFVFFVSFSPGCGCKQFYCRCCSSAASRMRVSGSVVLLFSMVAVVGLSYSSSAKGPKAKRLLGERGEGGDRKLKGFSASRFSRCESITGNPYSIAAVLKHQPIPMQGCAYKHQRFCAKSNSNAWL